MLDKVVSALSNYAVVLEPDKNVPEWWAGAPSVAHAPDGTFYLATRMREGDSPRGKRGYEIRILKSRDGRRFEPVDHVRREDARVPAFERPAIVVDPKTGLFRLYGCAPLEKDGWSILRFDDVKDPAQFDGRTMRPVLSATEREWDGLYGTQGYKDPFILWHRGRWHMFVIGFDRIERAYYFTSSDGESWEPASDGPILENRAWHNFYTRPACLLPLEFGYLLVYEGSQVGWHDPVYNIATGLAYSADLRTFIELTPDAPLLKSTTPGDCHTWRYSHWLRVGDQIRVYFEAARPNNTNETRMAEFKANSLVTD